MVTIPRLIKDTRRDLRESQSDFGKRFGTYTQQAVSKWEQGTSVPGKDVLEYVFNFYFKHEAICRSCRRKGILKDRDNKLNGESHDRPN